MALFVLVHGSWHGGWCWKAVTPLLRATGHEVCAPTLTGLGERAHLLTPDVGLDTHIQDLVNVLEYEELDDVILVGHSYGGMVITGLADRVPGHLHHLVYLDAFVPASGQALVDILRPGRRDLYRQQAAGRGDGWRIPPPSAHTLGASDATQARWLDGKLTPQPLRTFDQPVHLREPVPTLPRTYIHCTAGPLAPGFAPFATRAREAPSWRYRALATGHDAMITAPGELAALLLTVAALPED